MGYHLFVNRTFWGGSEKGLVLEGGGGSPARVRDSSKRDFSAAQADTFARAKVKAKASVCFGPACGRQAK